MSNDNNKRIARNTLILYIRSFITMLVNLYTGRVVLQVLGTSDFGIYNVVGGVVVLFSFIQNAMSGATQRFLNYELGRNDTQRAHKVFCISMRVYVIIALIMILLSESVGLWFMETQLKIPQERMDAARWVYQFSILTFCINILRTPYNASIIAYEKLNIFAYASIAEVVLRLALVFMLTICTTDKLATYGIFNTLVSLLLLVILGIYCIRKFDICKYKRIWDKELFKEVFGFSSWSLFGSVANLGASQGINMLVNIFSGVVSNAALGVANQVNKAVYQFTGNFQTAFSPQIVKLYAAQESSKLHKLIYQSSKFSFFLIYLFSLPVIIYAGSILNLWLGGVVPENSTRFVQFILLFSIFESFSGPLWTAANANGKIRNYQICVSALILLNLPISFIILKAGCNPSYVMLVRAIVSVICMIYRILYLNKTIQLPSLQFFSKVFAPSLAVVVLTLGPSLIIKKLYPEPSLLALLALSFALFCLTSLAILGVGTNKSERATIYNGIKEKLALIGTKNRK